MYWLLCLSQEKNIPDFDKIDFSLKELGGPKTILLSVANTLHPSTLLL